MLYQMKTSSKCDVYVPVGFFPSTHPSAKIKKKLNEKKSKDEKRSKLEIRLRQLSCGRIHLSVDRSARPRRYGTHSTHPSPCITYNTYISICMAKRCAEQLFAAATVNNTSQQLRAMGKAGRLVFSTTLLYATRCKWKVNETHEYLSCVVCPVYYDEQSPDTCARTKNKTTQQNHVSHHVCQAIFSAFHPQSSRAKEIRQ